MPKIKHHFLQQRFDSQISNKLTVFSVFLLYFSGTFIGSEVYTNISQNGLESFMLDSWVFLLHILASGPIM